MVYLIIWQKKDYIYKKIPFKFEILPICENIHLETRHGSINVCQRALSNSEFYWDGYSTTMSELVKNCSIRYISKHNITEKPKMKHIIPEGPHFRYHA